MRRLTFLSLAAVVLGCSALHAGTTSPTHPVLASPSGSSGLVVQGPGGSLVEADAPLFEFHSGMWLNLHHVLYEGARRQRVAQGAKLWGPPAFDIGPSQDALSPEARRTWQSAVDSYASTWAEKDLLFDEELSRIKAILARHEDDATLSDPDLPPQLQAALASVAPLYRSTVWPEHDRANRRWAATHAEDLERVGSTVRDALSRAFATPWPVGRVRVDLVVVANWAGAYTSEVTRLHIILSSLDPRDQGVSGLEILFHEASHGLSGKLERCIARSAERLGVQEPPNLWHAALFYTVGEVFRHHFPDYTPYGFSQHVYEHGWGRYVEPLQTVWAAYLSGQDTLERAAFDLTRAAAQRDGDAQAH